MPKFQHMLHIGPRRQIGRNRKRRRSALRQNSGTAGADKRTRVRTPHSAMNSSYFVWPSCLSEESLILALLAKNEVHAEAADFNYVTVVQLFGTSDGCAVHFGDFVAGTDIVAVVALVNLGGELRFEPALEVNRRHFRFADDGQLVGDDVFLLIGVVAQYNQRGHLDATSGKLCALAH